ncbi:MarR family winged helix-turn-helix transcriptional regulator [Pengzhenrongella phosphoraccumulans]|uniref:MarR family winged helix-turn-helix transcriptional regulator n=1 Tax=Pengzhenrongella phosphoraccumulans TaxID=3114394 RepID=UPI003890E2ED
MTDDVADPYPSVERELGLLMRRARASAAAVSARVHPDLDAGAYPLLVHIARVPGVRGCDLATHVGVGRATISRQLHRLVELGLITRKPDPHDARGQQLELTPEGTRLVADAGDARRSWLHAALNDWTADDVATLAWSLGRLNEALDGAARRA